MRESRFHKGVLLAGALLVAEAATTTSARAQSDRPPIFDFAPGAAPRARSDGVPPNEQKPDYLVALNQRISALYDAGKYAEAIPLAERALELTRSQRGPDHLDTATRMGWLALLYTSVDRTAEAEPLHQRSIALIETALGSDHPNVGTSLNNLAELYRAQGRYAEAEPLMKRALTIREKALGPNHPDVSASLSNLAALYSSQGRHAEAEPLYKRALAIDEKALGPNHPNIATVLYHLGALYRAQGRYADAEPLYKRVLAIDEKVLGPDHRDVAASLANLAQLYFFQARYADAEPLMKRALTIAENAVGPDHPYFGTMLNHLAALYRAQGRYVEAQPLFQRSLTIREKSLGPDHPDVGQALHSLAGLYRDQGRYAEAEPLMKRALTIAEKALGPDHVDIGGALDNLGALYLAQDRAAEAEPLMKRALTIAEKALGPDHPNVAIRLNNLASVYENHGRTADAEPLYQRALAIFERALGPDNPNVGTSLSNLAGLYRDQGRYSEAEPLYIRAVTIGEKTVGPDHPALALRLNNLSLLYLAQRRAAEAEPLLKRALTIVEKALGPDHPDIGTMLNNLAGLHFVQRDWARAADLWRRSANLAVRRTRRGTDEVGQTLTGKRRSEAERESSRFKGLIQAVYRLASEGRSARNDMASEMFQMAQWAFASEAAQSLTQMAARKATTDQRLSRLVRERQDLVGEWQQRDHKHIVSVSQAPHKRDTTAETTNMARLAAIDTQIAKIDKELTVAFPDYVALVNPGAASVEDIQAQLAKDEALLLFLDTQELEQQPMPEESFLWVVTKTDMRWVRLELGTKALTERVAALRCGLDAAAWGDGAIKCADLLKLSLDKAPKENEPLPFDLASAHDLYQALFGQVADLINGKHLLIVPSGPLTQLPFQVLVTQKSDTKLMGTDAFRRAEWLSRSNTIAVLPAVSSLKALRQHAKTSRATKPFVGFGNPLLDGSDPQGSRAKLARDKQECPKTARQRVAGPFGVHGGVRSITQRSGLVDVADIRSQIPLPETADELCAVARDLRVAYGDILLGARANEREIKSLSENGSLAAYRIVHFATHGVLAGELTPGTEPGLILTPPEKATAEDDGYLSASEIAGLKLDADWVILSACNTAAGGSDKAEALSGLARAFFYAGARALLVSHWAVYSDSTVKLITKALSTMAADKKVGRSEALRRSMLALIDKGEPHEAHPSYWAPFVVVGEGSAEATSPETSSITPRPVQQPLAKSKSNRPGQSSKKSAIPGWQTELWRQ